MILSIEILVWSCIIKNFKHVKIMFFKIYLQCCFSIITSLFFFWALITLCIMQYNAWNGMDFVKIGIWFFQRSLRLVVYNVSVTWRICLFISHTSNFSAIWFSLNCMGVLCWHCSWVLLKSIILKMMSSSHKTDF